MDRRSPPPEANASGPAKETKSAAEVLLNVRKNARSKLTRLIHRMENLIEAMGSRTELRAYRAQLTEVHEECCQAHAEYMAHIGERGDEISAGEWQRKLDEDTNGCYALLDAYLVSRSKDASSVYSQSTVVSSRRQSLLEAEKRRRETELRMRQNEREVEQRAAEIRALKALEAEAEERRLRIEQQRQRRELSNQLERDTLSVEMEEIEEDDSPIIEIHEAPSTRERRNTNPRVRNERAPTPRNAVPAATLQHRTAHNVNGVGPAPFQQVSENPHGRGPDQLTAAFPALTTSNQSPPQCSTWPFNGPAVQTSTGEPPDAWIAQINSPPYQTTSFPSTFAYSSWLSGIIPKVDITPFDGNPKNWPLFIATFKSLVHDVLPNDAQRIAILRQLLEPKVREGIAQTLLSPSMYKDALAELQETYGDQQLITRCYIKKLLDMPPLKHQDYESLHKFWKGVHSLVNALIHCGYRQELSSAATLEQLVDKLPTGMRSKWGRRVLRMEPNLPTLADFDAWLKDIAKGEVKVRHIDTSADDAPEPTEAKKKASKFIKPKPKIHTPTVLATHVESEHPDSSATCPACEKTHPLSKCERFASLNPTERINMVKDNGCCFRCLNKGHISRKCRTRTECSIGDCKSLHHRLLHDAPRVFERKTKSNKGPRSGKEPNEGSRESEEGPYVNTVTADGSTRRVLLIVVPVRLYADGKSVDTLALLDGGSETSLIRRDAATELGLKGERVLMRIGTYRGNDPVSRVAKVDFEIKSVKNDASFNVREALSVPKICLSRRIVDWPNLKTRWPHLADLDLQRIDTNDVTVLIGMDVPKTHRQLDYRESESDDSAPVAFKFPFGWSAVGGLTTNQLMASTSCNLLNTATVADHTELDDTLERFWTIESLGLTASKPPMSEAEHQARKMLETSTTHDGQRYQIGLPWKSPSTWLPDNRSSALNRLFAVERKFRRDPAYSEKYTAAIEEYIKLGHAKKLSLDELRGVQGRVWYLPHHGVTNPNKPGKVRVVFDASSVFNGSSLNTSLLQGPDLLVNLVGLLIRFRERPIAVSSDIEKMFHQVRVKPEDQDALRFLWRRPGEQAAPQTYRMTVQVFGAVSSPAVCMYALRRTAVDFGGDRPDLVRKVETQFYVDNYLDSMESETDAVEICRALTELLARGGFRLTKWLSGSRNVMAALPAGERLDPSLNIDLDDLPIERTLGVLWNAGKDAFQFRILAYESVCTKRGVLRAVASIFDPLGFLAPVILIAKALMQEVWRRRLDWDDELPAPLQKAWSNWASDLVALESLTIPRCLRNARDSPSCLQIHTFCDASEAGYGAATYLRFEYPSGLVSVSLVLAKTRVAPVKQLTIPRLELLGAVIASRLTSMVISELRTKPEQVFLWTDSTTVLKWINSRTCRFTTFVANRIGEILELTHQRQWRHVPGEANPADLCSRGVTATNLVGSHEWFHGPEFLQHPPQQRPKTDNGKEPEPDDPEILPSKWVGLLAVVDDSLHDLASRTTNLGRLKRVVAYVFRFYHNCRAKKELRVTGPLRADEVKEAFQICLKAAQSNAFKEEIDTLKAGRSLRSTSRLLKLHPYLDQDEIIRSDGRVHHAEVDPNTKNPIILCPDSPLTRLLITNAHEHTLHASTERTLAEVQQNYWILKGRSTVQKYIRNCPVCRRLRSKPQTPLMAALPRERLQAFTPPFHNTGIDFFGPLFVVIHRRTHKRYGCLFTCLVTRAVHIEITHTLETDSFIMALRRFISKRRCPATCFSDNGTNLVAGEKELQDCLRRLNQTIVGEEAVRRGIRWHFSPPAAPHFGGVWERLVRSAKMALRATLKNRTVTDEVLLTVMAEVESLMNGRPLTHVSLDPSDLQPITPNHFLLGRANPNTPVDVLDDKDLDSRKRWRCSQAITELFWRRWLREYVPTLIERRKWLQDRRNLKVDDVVLIVDPATPRGQWPLGRILEPLPGPDGVTRAARVKTANSEFVRPVAKLCLLEEASAGTEKEGLVFSAENRAGDVPDKGVRKGN